MQKLITHDIVSLYNHPSEKKSFVKFGSYDPTAIPEGEELNMIKTIDKTTWGLRVKEMVIESSEGEWNFI